MENACFGSRVVGIVVGVISCAATLSVNAFDATPAPAGQADLVLPTVLFHADAAGNDLFDALHSSPLLAHLSKEAPGAPIQLRIYHSVHPAHVDAKNFFSGLLSVGTLGLSPVVMSGEHTLHYELYVNGQRVARHEYSANLSRKQYLRGNTADATHGLGPDGQVWAKSTVDLFLKDLAHDDAVRMLTDEYQRYFGVPSAAVPSPACVNSNPCPK
ncbi:MAG: hypothetical protein JSR66_31510 [Proteobacteria bacterium]|nr:hypothetical protein [Pseudomonadota bacterium]